MNYLKQLITILVVCAIIIPLPAKALDQAQRFEIERRPSFDPTDCAPGGGTFGGNVTDKSTKGAIQGQTYWLGDSISVGLKQFGGLETKLNAKGYPAKINANAGRSITSPGISGAGGGGTHRNGLEAVTDDSEYIKGSSNIIIALGTNLENDFSKQQADLVAKIKQINPTINIYWVDISAVGTGSYSKTQAQSQNIVILDNASKLGYGSLSQFKIVWGQDQDPRTLSTKSMPDPNTLLSNDGIHYAGGEAYTKVAEELVSKFSAAAPTNDSSTSSLGSCGICSVSGGGSGGDTPTDESSLVGANNEEKIFNYLISSGPGLNAIQAAGIMGNLQAESGFNPAITEIGNGVGYGLAQWSFGRRTALEAAATKKGVEASNLLFQLEFLVAESQSRPSLDFLGTSEWEGLKKIQTVEEAVIYWEKNFERPGVAGKPIRTQFAKAVLTKPYASNAPGATPTAGGSSSCGTPSAPTITVDPKIESATKDQLVDIILKNPKIKIAPKPGANVVEDLKTVAQKDLLRAIAIVGSNFSKPVTLELIASGQSRCGDFIEGATNYGPFTSSHSYGLAVDFTANNADPTTVELFKFLYENKDVLRLGELEHSPVPTGTSNIKFGKDYTYPEAVQQDHQAHIHVGVKGSGEKASECQAKPTGEKV